MKQLHVAVLAAMLMAPLAAHGQGVAPVATEFDKLHFRSIGPATMSGRISDFAVYEANPAIYYVATAHGGVWKTTSNGALFTPLFQDQGLIAIGDVTVSQTNPDLVWVGTGESNNRQSTSFGDGVYKSTDGGKTFQNMGLKTSRHINRILIDPNNNDVVLVAATGQLFGPGGERGVYKTTDGGRSWKLVLKGDDDTGANDLAMSPTDAKTIYASMYQRRRTACCMNGGGPGSGIFKSTDGGDTWTKLTGGLPTGSLGRIALDVFRRSSNLVYASIEGPGGGGRGAGPAPEGADPAAAPAGGGRAGGGGRGGAGAADAGTTGLYRSDDGGTNWRKVSSVNPRPMYFSQVRVDPNNPDRVYMGGVKMQMTVDGGRTFETSASLVIHDDIHAIWIDPANSDHVLIGGDGGIGVSYDMSKTWAFLPNLPVGLFYHVSYDMETPYNVCGGMQDNYDWCGPSASRQGSGIMNYDWFQVQGGDGFVALQDLRDSRIVYTESQDGNIIRRNKVTGESRTIRPSPANVFPAPPKDEPAYRFHWDTPMILSPNDPGTLLVGANRVFKSTDRGDSWTVISPDLTSNAKRDTIVTMGLKGSDITISRDDGIQVWPAIVALGESPRQAGVYYTGTDDGTVSVSRDGGKTWANITSKLPGFPKGGFVSKVAPSRYDAGTVYVTVDNHRLNDYNTYIWVSNDFGATFRSLNANLSGENVRTLTEDLRNADVLYIGTESGIFLTLDRGKNWKRLKANFPTVRVDEITLHPRDNAMLVATHGRALWILDHLEPIQEYTAANAAADAKLYSVPNALQWKYKDDRNDEFWGHQYFIGENPPAEAVISFNLKRTVADLKVRIADGSGRTVRELNVPSAKNVAGMQTVCWDQRIEPIAADTTGGRGGFAGGGGGGGGGRGGRGGAAVPGVPMPLPTPGYLPANPCAGPGGGGGGGGGGFFGGGGAAAGPYVLPGTFTVSLVAGGKTLDSKPMRITMDPEVRIAAASRQRYNEVVTDLHETQRKAAESQRQLAALYPQMAPTAEKLKGMANVPADVKAQFDALNKDFDAVRVKFGVPAAAGGGRGGGGGGRGGVDPANVLGRAEALKGALLGVWEAPSDASLRVYNDVRGALPKAMAEASAVMAKAATVSAALKKFEVTLNVGSK